jgi:hypothetical protein
VLGGVFEFELFCSFYFGFELFLAILYHFSLVCRFFVLFIGLAVFLSSR